MILVDCNSIIMRYFFALKEDVTEIEFWFFNLIKKMLYKYKNHEIAFFFDCCRNNFRKKLNTEYKSNRPKLNKDIIDKMTEIRMKLLDNKFPVYWHDEYEADDLIGSFSEIYKNSNEIIILSTDKDLVQLIDNQTALLNPFTNQLLKYDDIYTKYGVIPENFALYLAVVGDSSDNIQGLKGYGKKRAPLLIQEKSQELYKELYETLLLTTIVRNIKINIFDITFFQNTDDKLINWKNCIQNKL